MTKEIVLNHITKIEGHAKLELGIDQGKITKCELSSVEGSRYFEGIVKGRQYNEAHEMTSRICGICSCAHVIAAISAVEDAVHYTPTKQTKELRLLLTYGERIRSHATHLYFLVLPDYLGYESALAMASKYKKELQVALSLIKLGNNIIKCIGGRDLHPVSATPGGWLKLPKQDDLDAFVKLLQEAKGAAKKTCDLFLSLEYPKFQSGTECFALRQNGEYATLDGIFTGDNGSFAKERYREFIKEYHEPRSTANFVVKKDHRYMVGALPRINHNAEYLSDDAKSILKSSPLKKQNKNPFLNNIAQAIELMHCIDESMRICGTLKIIDEKLQTISLRQGTGVGCVEVPRGTLWHEYSISDKGVITGANIITPTAQNLLNMQEDIRDYVPSLLSLPKEKITLQVEKLIRSYDPCFSCSAHFLEVNWS